LRGAFSLALTIATRGPAGNGGCTLMPDAHLFAVIDRAIQADLSRLPKRQ
jgi:hypothetical protein